MYAVFGRVGKLLRSREVGSCERGSGKVLWAFSCYLSVGVGPNLHALTANTPGELCLSFCFSLFNKTAGIDLCSSPVIFVFLTLIGIEKQKPIYF